MYDSVLSTSLENYSVIYKMGLCYVLRQAHSKSWYIQAYSALLRHAVY